MITGKRELVVPVRDRRRRKRIVTLRNSLYAALVAFGLFIVVTIRSEMRGNHQDNYGRIVRSELPAPPTAKSVDVVTEAPEVRDETSVDPMLIQPAVRAQFLGDTTLEPVPVTDTTTLPPPAQTQTGDARMVIVGGTEGVSIVRDERPQVPKLGGGFGRQ